MVDELGSELQFGIANWNGGMRSAMTLIAGGNATLQSRVAICHSTSLIEN
jgi:hypothetical protein